MAKIMTECPKDAEPETRDKFWEEIASKCKIGRTQTAQALQDAGTAKSERDAARQIAEDMGESKAAVRQDIMRGKKEVVQPEPNSQLPETTQKPKDEKDEKNFFQENTSFPLTYS